MLAEAIETTAEVSRSQYSTDQLPVNVQIESCAGSSTGEFVVKIQVPSPFGNLLVDLEAAVSPSQLDNLKNFFNKSQFAKNGDSFQGAFQDLKIFLTAVIDNKINLYRPGAFTVQAGRACANGKAPVNLKEEQRRIDTAAQVINRIHEVRTVLISPHRVSIEESAQALDNNKKRNDQGVIWLDINLGGTFESDQKDFYPELIHQVVQAVFPSAFGKDGHAAKRGAPDFHALDMRELHPKIGSGNKFLGRVFSPKIIACVGEGMFVTAHTGDLAVVTSSRDDLVRDGWDNQQSTAGAGNVLLRVIEKLQANNDQTLRKFEVSVLKISQRLRDSEDPLSKDDNCLLADMTYALNYMSIQQAGLTRSLAALKQAALRDNLVDIFCHDIQERGFAKVDAAKEISARDADRIEVVKKHIENLHLTNQTRILEITRKVAERTREIAEKTAAENARSNLNRERWSQMLGILSGVALPCLTGLTFAQVFPEFRVLASASGLLASLGLLGVGTWRKAINWNLVFTGK